ncbi:hypothetical protein [Streptomyces bathyalis]|nr:hypothetical protein [Streptomyces bathyalis]
MELITTMKVLCIHGTRDMRLEDVAVLEPADSEVLLRVRYVRVCAGRGTE